MRFKNGDEKLIFTPFINILILSLLKNLFLELLNIFNWKKEQTFTRVINYVNVLFPLPQRGYIEKFIQEFYF